MHVMLLLGVCFFSPLVRIHGNVSCVVLIARRAWLARRSPAAQVNPPVCCKWVGGRVSSIYCTLIPWCPPSRRVCALVLRRLCAFVPRCSGALMLVYLGAPAPWCSSALVPRRFGAQEPWCSSAWVQLRHGALAPFECHPPPPAPAQPLRSWRVIYFSPSATPCLFSRPLLLFLAPLRWRSRCDV